MSLLLGGTLTTLIRELMEVQDKGQARDSPVPKPGLSVHQAGLHPVGVAGSGPQARDGLALRQPRTLNDPWKLDWVYFCSRYRCPVSPYGLMPYAGTSCARQFLLMSMEMSRQMCQQSNTKCRISYERVPNDSATFLSTLCPVCDIFPDRTSRAPLVSRLSVVRQNV